MPGQLALESGYRTIWRGRLSVDLGGCWRRVFRVEVWETYFAAHKRRWAQTFQRLANRSLGSRWGRRAEVSGKAGQLDICLY